MSEDPSEQATSGRDVFVSYASQDVGVADSVVENIERRGIKCWIAPRDVTPGSQYADEIVGAINNAKVVVLVLSEHAVASAHVGREIERAASKRRRVIALRTDAAPLTRSFEYFLSESQWIDAAALGMSGALAKLAQTVGHASTTSASPAGGIADSASLRAKRFFGMTKRLAVAGLVVIMAIGLAVGIYLLRSKQGKAQAPVVAAISDKSIAVLPFADMSQKKDQEYFGDGMAEEILDLLAKIPGLTVIGRTSSFQFKGKNEDLRKIGTELNAAYVLEGSVRNSGDRVRITAQLINTRTGAHEWSETYDRPIGDVLKLQDAIAAAVVRELQLTVAPDYLNSRPAAKDLEVYELYLRGRHAFDRHESGAFDEAAALFQRALDRDPTFTDAEVWLGWTRSSQGQMEFLAPNIAFEDARRAAMIALKQDPNRADAHAVLGAIHTIYDWDWAAAEHEFRQVAVLAPGGMDAIYGQELLSLTFGRWDDALRNIKAAIGQDPLDPDGYFLLSSLQTTRGHLPEAEVAARRVLDIHPSFGYAHYYLGLILMLRGDREGALLQMQRETTDEGKQQGLAIVFNALGRRMESDAHLAGMLRDQADGNAMGIADVYALRGQPDEAMHWLERAYVQKDPELYVVKCEAELQSLRTDPRYKAFLKKMNLPE
jgi:TolB-like protein